MGRDLWNGVRKEFRTVKAFLSQEVLMEQHRINNALYGSRDYFF